MGILLQQLVIGYLSTLKEIHTLSTGKVNKIISVKLNEFYVETETSKARYLAGEKKQPYDIIPESFILEVWKTLCEKRSIHAGDLQAAKGRSSFLLALFSKLPFVRQTLKDGRTAIELIEYYVHELPESYITFVLDFLDEVAEGKIHPQTLTQQIQDKNLQRIKSSYRQGLRLLGFIDARFNVNSEFVEQYRNSSEKKEILKNQILKLPYFFMVKTLLSAPNSLSMSEKIKGVKVLGLLVVRNPIGGNLMKESVGEKLSRNTFSWLQYVDLLQEGITENLISTDKGVSPMQMVNKSTFGICYSNISLIKKALMQSSDNILPYPEILLYLKKNWTNLNSTTDDIKRIVDLALYAPKSYFYEVEDGLWGIKDKTDARLNHIYLYMNQHILPLKITDMRYRLKVYEREDILRQMLLSDIRFSQIENTAYWVLSEWVMINNFVYDYIFKSELLGIERDKVIERVVQINKLDKEKVIFLPQFDDRFSVFGTRIEIKRALGINQNKSESQELDVPVEISEEVGRISYKIINFIKESQKEVTTNQIINHVLTITQNEPSFSIYSEAVKDLLEAVSEIKQVEEHKWIYSNEAPHLQKESDKKVYYAVKDSSPTIENVKELLNNYNQNAAQSQKQGVNFSRIEPKATEDKMYAYHTVSYYDRVKGYFIIPKALIEMSVLFRQSNHGKVTIQHEEYQYEWNWEKTANKYYFFSDGVMDFFADYLIEPGHKLSFEIDKQVMYLIRVHKVGFDERYASEQQRYLDIGRLVEESKSVNKSIFSLMCETLAIHPSGMHWSMLQDKISEKRSTTKNTVTNLLSRNECFEQVEGKKGYWKLNISKLSRYYINEENKKMIEPAESEIDSLEGGREEYERSMEVPIEKVQDPINSDEAETAVSSVELNELQQLDTQTLIQQIESLFSQITEDEINFKESISERVQENFINGDISAIEELYRSIEQNIKFFERVRKLENERERKNEE